MKMYVFLEIGAEGGTRTHYGIQVGILTNKTHTLLT